MAPRKKRSNEDVASDLHNSAKKSRSLFDSSKKETPMDSGFVASKCMNWFNEYSLKEKQIGPEGIERFCEDLDIQPDDIVMLVLAHLMNAKRMGYFTKEEWNHAMSTLRVDSTDKLKKKLPILRNSLKDPSAFKSIYRFAFGFSLEDGHKSMDVQTTISMLNVLLTERWPLCHQFFTFLKNSHHKVINRDQWNNILEFSRLVKPDLSNYEEDSAWPVLLDEFAEWLKTGTNVSSQNESNTLDATSTPLTNQQSFNSFNSNENY